MYELYEKMNIENITDNFILYQIINLY